MATNFHENLADDTVEFPSERSTGLVFAAVAAIVAVIFRHNPVVLVPAIAATAGFAGLALAAPRHLRTVNVLWFKFGQLLHHLMNPLIMGLMYIVAIVPVGLVMQLCRDPLRKRRDPGADTYWVSRQTSGNESPMTEQF